MLAALSTTTAMEKFAMFCWKDRLRSAMMKTSKSACASASKRPFLMPFQPISWTVFTSWPERSRRSRQSRHSSRSSFTSRRCQQFFLCRFDKADDLLSLHRGKAGEKLVNGLAAFQIVHKVLYRDARAGEDGCAPQDLRIGVEHCAQVEFFHVENLAPPQPRARREHRKWANHVERDANPPAGRSSRPSASC